MPGRCREDQRGVPPISGSESTGQVSAPLVLPVLPRSRLFDFRSTPRKDMSSQLGSAGPFEPGSSPRLGAVENLHRFTWKALRLATFLTAGVSGHWRGFVPSVIQVALDSWYCNLAILARVSFG